MIHIICYDQHNYFDPSGDVIIVHKIITTHIFIMTHIIITIIVIIISNIVIIILYNYNDQFYYAITLDVKQFSSLNLYGKLLLQMSIEPLM